MWNVFGQKKIVIVRVWNWKREWSFAGSCYSRCLLRQMIHRVEIDPPPIRTTRRWRKGVTFKVSSDLFLVYVSPVSVAVSMWQVTPTSLFDEMLKPILLFVYNEIIEFSTCFLNNILFYWFDFLSHILLNRWIISILKNSYYIIRCFAGFLWCWSKSRLIHLNFITWQVSCL